MNFREGKRLAVPNGGAGELEVVEQRLKLIPRGRLGSAYSTEPDHHHVRKDLAPIIFLQGQPSHLDARWLENLSYFVLHGFENGGRRLRIELHEDRKLG
jgi:hypothetical protein